MFTLLLLTIITLTSSLHGMNNNQSDWELYKNVRDSNHHHSITHPYNPNNIETYGNIINVTAALKDWRTIAKFLHLCFPPEVGKHITQYLSEDITTKYKHKLITHKWQNNDFTHTYLYRNNDAKWDYIVRHDGSYNVASKTDNPYAMYNENTTINRHYIEHNNKQYSTMLRAQPDKEGLACSLAVLDSNDTTQQNKKFLFLGKNYIHSFNFEKPVLHYALSNDGNWLAIENPHEKNLSIIGSTNTKDGVPSQSFCLNGNISTLCAAHHSPVFVAGSDQTHTTELSNLIFIGKKSSSLSAQPNDPITGVEFSPDDKRLLSCSLNKKTYISELCLWNSSNFETISLIRSEKAYPYIRKAFFICDGQYILTMQGNRGDLYLYNGLTGKYMHRIKCDWDPSYSHGGQITPIIIWSTKNNLLMAIFNYTLRIYSPKTGKLLTRYPWFKTAITGMGLTIDEKTLMMTDKDNGTYELKLYDEQDYQEIDFIENKANIIDLYEMLALHKKAKALNKFDTKDDKYINCEAIKHFVVSMKSYIQEQLHPFKI